MTPPLDGAADTPAATRHIVWTPTTAGRVAYQVDTLIMRQAMIRAGQRQTDVAAGSGLSRSMIGDVLSGRRQPSERALKAIAEVLHVDPRALLLRAPSAALSGVVRTKGTAAA